MTIEETPIDETELDADEPNLALRASITELKEDEPSPDWDKLEAKLFARIETSQAPKKSNVVWIAVAATLAAAAAGALWLGKGPDETTVANNVPLSLIHI